MSLQDEIKISLEQIKSIKGVENVVLTQRDGNPIQYSGIWLSKNEVFNVCTATSAIFNCGLQLHKDTLKYILLEGQKAKIMISPLRNSDNPTLNKILDAQGLQGNDDEFFVGITAQPLVNLGGVLLKTRQSLMDIKKALIISGESFKPPLRHFTEDELKKMYDSFNTMEDLNRTEKLGLVSMNFSADLSDQLEKVLIEFGTQTMDLIDTYVTMEGGFVASRYSNDTSKTIFSLESDASMSYSLFLTADKCAWFLKKMHLDSILLECEHSFQFIQKLDAGIFSATIAKGRQKLGLLRLMLPRYCNKIVQILKTAKELATQKVLVQDFKSMFSELTLNN